MLFRAILPLSIIALLTATPSYAHNHDDNTMKKVAVEAATETQDLTVSQAWVRETPPTVSLTAAYMMLKNPSDVAKILVGGSSPQFQRVEIHESLEKDGMAIMRPLAQIEIPAGQSADLKPGGLHIMLIGSEQPIQVGETVELTLQYADGHSQTLQLPIQTAAPE